MSDVPRVARAVRIEDAVAVEIEVFPGVVLAIDAEKVQRVAAFMRMVEAKGVAEATRIKGEAEATYNARVAASLTPPLIQQQYLSKWDGRLPQYTFGGNAMPLLQLPVAAGGPGDGTRR